MLFLQLWGSDVESDSSSDEDEPNKLKNINGKTNDKRETGDEIVEGAREVKGGAREEGEDEQEDAEREEVYEFLATQRARHDATSRIDTGGREQSLTPSMRIIASIFDI